MSSADEKRLVVQKLEGPVYAKAGFNRLWNQVTGYGVPRQVEGIREKLDAIQFSGDPLTYRKKDEIESFVVTEVPNEDEIVQLSSYKTHYNLAEPYIDVVSLNQKARDIYNGVGTYTASDITASYINIATTLVTSYKSSYNSSIAAIPELTGLSDAAVTATIGETPSITSNSTAQSQITTYSEYNASLVTALKSALTAVQNSYTTELDKVPFPRQYPVRSVSISDDQREIDAVNGPLFYITRSNITDRNIVPSNLTSSSTTISDQSDTTKNGTYTATYEGEQSQTADYIYKIFRGHDSSALYVNGPGSLVLQIPSKKRLIGYIIKWSGTVPGRTNESGTCFIEGSNDNKSWDEIDKFNVNTINSWNAVSKTFTNATHPYIYFRIRMTVITSVYFVRFYEFLGIAESTKPEQLIHFYLKYKSLRDVLQLISFYSSARLYIADSDLKSTTLAVKNGIYNGTSQSPSDLTDACSDILQAAINRYWLLKNSSDSMSTIVSTYAESASAPSTSWSNPPSSAIPTSDSVTSLSNSLDGMQTLFDKYFTGSTALWPVFISTLSQSVKDAIGSYSSAATAAGIAVDSTVISRDLSGAEIVNADLSVRSGLMQYGRTPIAQSQQTWTDVVDGVRMYLIGVDQSNNLYYFKNTGTRTGSSKTIWINDGTTTVQLSGVLTGTDSNIYFKGYGASPDAFYSWTEKYYIKCDPKTKRWTQNWMNINMRAFAIDSRGAVYASGINRTQTKWGEFMFEIVRNYNGVYEIIQSSKHTNVYSPDTAMAELLCFDKNDNLYGIFIVNSSRSIHAVDYEVRQWSGSGSTWTKLCTANDVIKDMGWDNTTFYLQGSFTRITPAGGREIAISGIAKWNGSVWSNASAKTSGSGYYFARTSTNGIEATFTRVTSSGTISFPQMSNLDRDGGSAPIILVHNDIQSTLYSAMYSLVVNSYLGTTSSFLEVLNILTLKYRIATFRFLYQTARRYITDTELLETTVATRNSIYTNVSVSYAEYLAARRDILKTLIAKYWLLNPTNAEFAPSPAPVTPLLPSSAPSSSSVIPTTDLITDMTSDATLDTLNSKYLTGTTALWPALMTRIRASIIAYIEQYKTERANAVTRGDITASVTSDTVTFIRDTTCEADKTNVSADAVRSVSALGVVSFTINTESADSEYGYVANVYAKYKIAIDTILSSIRTNATSALQNFSTYYNTTLTNCLPISSISTEIQSAIDGQAGDTTLINAAISIPIINTYASKYRKGIASLFNAVRDDQLVIANQYVKLFNKYVEFIGTPDISGFGVSLYLIPTTLPNGVNDQSIISVLPTMNETAQPTSAQMETLGRFCTSYNGPAGFYAQLVTHIRTNLSSFILEFERRWFALSDDVKSAYSSYTFVLTGEATTLPTSTTDAQLYTYMNQYAGLPQDSFASAGSAAAEVTASTVSFTSTFTTAKNQADALAQILDFGNLYVAFSDFLYGTVSEISPINNLIRNVESIIEDTSANLVLAFDTVTSTTNPTFTTTLESLINIVQRNMNSVLLKYADIYRAYGGFMSGFSGVAELPTLTFLSAMAPTWTGTTPVTGMVYTFPASGVYTQTNSGSDRIQLLLYGSFTGYGTFTGYLEFVEEFQGLVAGVQTNLSGFRDSAVQRISGLPTVFTNSLDTDSYSESIGKAITAITTMDSLGKTMAVWFMKTVLIDTWNVGAKYLSSSDVTTEMTAFVGICANYLEASGAPKSSPLVFASGDTSASLVRTAGDILRDMAIALASRYNTCWITWVTGGRIQPTSNIVLPNTINEDIASGSDAVRIKYLDAWLLFINAIKTATLAKITVVNEISEWLKGTAGTEKMVNDISTKAMGRP